MSKTNARVFLGLIWGRISAPFKFKNEQKLPKTVYIIPNLPDLRFGENFMKIQTKMAKLQMHDNLHKTVNENRFSFLIFMQIFMSSYEWQLKQLISYMLLNPFKMVVQLF